MPSIDIPFSWTTCPGVLMSMGSITYIQSDCDSFIPSVQLETWKIWGNIIHIPSRTPVSIFLGAAMGGKKTNPIVEKLIFPTKICQEKSSSWTKPFCLSL